MKGQRSDRVIALYFWLQGNVVKPKLHSGPVQLLGCTSQVAPLFLSVASNSLKVVHALSHYFPLCFGCKLNFYADVMVFSFYLSQDQIKWTRAVVPAAHADM